MALNEGEVEVSVGDESLVLVPTLDAADRICAAFGGFRNAMDRVVAMDLDAITTVIGFGAGKKPSEIKALRPRIFADGILKFVVPASLFVGILTNGGRPLATDGAEPGATDANGGNVAGGQRLN